MPETDLGRDGARGIAPADVGGGGFVRRPVAAWAGLERFARFCMVGASGLVVNLAALWFAREHLFAHLAAPGLRLNSSLAFAIILATVNNFVWNRLWTWRDRQVGASLPAAAAQFGQYAIAVGIGTLVQVAATNILALRMHYLLANAMAIAAAAGVNYALNDAWTFRASTAR